MTSRNEEILSSIINGSDYNNAPQSRMEILLLALKAELKKILSSSDNREIFTVNHWVYIGGDADVDDFENGYTFRKSDVRSVKTDSTISPSEYVKEFASYELYAVRIGGNKADNAVAPIAGGSLEIDIYYRDKATHYTLGDSKINRNATKIVFGDAKKYKDVVAGVTGVAVDSENAGTIMRYDVTEADETVSTYYLSDAIIDAPKNCVRLFYQYYAGVLKTLDLSNFDTRNVTHMGYMFENCNTLESLDVSKFDTSNVTSLSGIFARCNALTSLDLSNFDTRKVTDMSYMFNECKNITTLDLSGFDTSNVTNMHYMFYNNKKLSTLKIDNFNTSKVKTMQYMFAGCEAIESIDVSNFDMSSVTTTERMFDMCYKIKEIDLSKANAVNNTSMDRMFNYCINLEKLNLSGMYTAKVTNMSSAFNNVNPDELIVKNRNPEEINLTLYGVLRYAKKVVVDADKISAFEADPYWSNYAGKIAAE